MIRYRRAYQMVATITVAALTWAIGLPVVHFACAMEAPAKPRCVQHDHASHGSEAPAHGHSDGSSEAPMHDHSDGPAGMPAHSHGEAPATSHGDHAQGMPAPSHDDLPCAPLGDLPQECCFFESGATDRQATPAQVSERNRLDAGIAVVFGPLVPDERPPELLLQPSGPASAPPLPFSSPAHLSVFLI